MDSNPPTTLPLLSEEGAPYLTVNPSQTRKLGEILAKEILKTKPRKDAFLLGLEGDLGGGKTTFLQGFAKGLGIKQKILSPTFLIIKKFSIFNFKFSNFYHIDCYRIEKPKEILDLGFKEIISIPQNIVAVEWADRIRKIMSKNTIWITFQFINKNKRKIAIKK
ncbi:MAG: tRNA (adenosine(37)-N6)-threonylcarbamoyltransferase complex ATPase subunit type 1 TsaE [Parcubacteria group bacterium CG2_30_36_18]|uniref:tRNA threonylcarbamoyladenosine biosynthesis protein TsaE n=4 Tax=Candidatus Nealsoniibacteriota TaxID=1817911 RepID=A0A2M8DLG8_9BACT|nr:MAG: tRNA (adenosine(37)-N6)-threonylcarbamoyltransferase complex ATPase subunit type 1 TsaE [Parcubacteria group bacterium CG2_30_36_18]PIP24697.1 MAG: tRNA (adenosine(37)-N6)-threonylcarbamoyltransferase complex ATPase subunit type 1 TsaE [Candidatus Nealsonbacteria bacterium CG23_combo_of_CG06-09_8_20_14_all_36_125]PIX88070.1 MAG: tRNA (adenosine(37)-N6)-threonylcarbamoyltransferase complex ATPase subunit type 1 TsaE [Candidatus Nealsonbacteria bacterium CG_4_10_14_3_um_filter_36_16]PJB986